MHLHRKWNKLGGKSPIVGYEKYGMMTDAFYLKKEQNERNYRFNIVELGGQLKKEDRIRRLIPLFQQKRIYFPSTLIYSNYAKNTVDLIRELINNEMLVFPVSAHDDMLDAMARICDEELYAHFPMVTQGIELNVHGVMVGNEEETDDWMSW